ncbi:AI-2E family transporter [Flavobacterium album]|uniref:AI-2E family transporter n=1 Tax=Flavobacterium album TaxID=2175091 RepID=A0A2S1R2J6_9FLAO|nr:AI-2E family transporter [Flavobacterium album]AWH86832.1 AI-2E family transporter [Flavobacterium album]
MRQTVQFPFYAKLALSLFIVIAITAILYIGQSVIIPLLMALLFAILLRPVANFMQTKMRLPHVIACLLTVILFVFFFAVIFYFISVQIIDMANDWNTMKANLMHHYHNLQEYVRDNFNLNKTDQEKLIEKAADGSLDSGKQIVGTTLLSFSDTMMNMVLVQVYIFLILLYRTHFIKFLCKLFDQKHHQTLQEILGTIKVSVQSYIVGLLIEFVIVSVLTAIGLMIIGVKYAILLGVITGLLNLIPYIGILIAGVLTIIASLTGTADTSIIIGIIVVNVVVQLIDNNLLVPMIVSSKVEINAIASIVGIIIGGMLGGISGMFLAIPLMAIMKVIFDRIDAVEPWGYLLGDDLPRTFKWRKKRKPQPTDAPEA